MPIMIEGTGRNLHFIGKLLLFVAASPAVTSSAQTAVLPSVSAPPRPVNAAAAAPVFEVATVKLNKSGSSGSHSSLDNGRFTASNILLKNLIQYQAYGIRSHGFWAARSGLTLNGSTSKQRQIARSPISCEPLAATNADF